MTITKLEKRIETLKKKLSNSKKNRFGMIENESEIHHDIDLLNKTINGLERLERSLENLKM